MGVALGDINHTGRLSLLVSHFSDEYATLYRNDGHMNFTDVSHTAGIAQATVPFVGWGDAFLDLSNSGWQDALLVNGHVYPQVDNSKTGVAYREPKLVYRNRHDGTFDEVSRQAGEALQQPQVSRGLAVGDLFNSGRMNVVIENLVGGPMVLEARPDRENHFVSLSLEGAGMNTSALNARVQVTIGGVTQIGEVRSGGSYLSQSDLRLHFGMGRSAIADVIDVTWPDGKKQHFEKVSADRFYALKEGGEMRVLPVVPLVRKEHP